MYQCNGATRTKYQAIFEVETTRNESQRDVLMGGSRDPLTIHREGGVVDPDIEVEKLRGTLCTDCTSLLRIGYATVACRPPQSTRGELGTLGFDGDLQASATERRSCPKKEVFFMIAALFLMNQDWTCSRSTADEIQLTNHTSMAGALASASQGLISKCLILGRRGAFVGMRCSAVRDPPAKAHHCRRSPRESRKSSNRTTFSRVGLQRSVGEPFSGLKLSRF
jgi:hypothetical protein